MGPTVNTLLIDLYCNEQNHHHHHQSSIKHPIS